MSFWRAPSVLVGNTATSTAYHNSCWRVDPATALKAEQQIESCEHCHPDDAEIPLDWILAEVTSKWGPYDFVLTGAVRCPNCKHAITEETLIEPKLN